MKKKLQREGIFKEMKQRRAYEKPSEKKARQVNDSTRRFKKMLRKRIEIQGRRDTIIMQGCNGSYRHIKQGKAKQCF